LQKYLTLLCFASIRDKGFGSSLFVDPNEVKISCSLSNFEALLERVKILSACSVWDSRDSFVLKAPLVS
jgi:hypothetical protein